MLPAESAVPVVVLQAGPEMMLVSSVTAPVCARSRPSKFAPVPMLMDVSARTLPKKVVPEPIVAELATFHHTLQAEAILFRNWTLAPIPGVVTSEAAADAVRKIQTPLGAPVSFKVSVPDSENESAQ
jgi:hypothetical protein